MTDAPGRVGPEITATQIDERLRALRLHGPDFTAPIDGILAILRKLGYLQ